MAVTVSEREFQSQVLELAELLGFEKRYHTHDSRRSDPGFPDLVLIHPVQKRVIFAEIKTDSGKPTNEQLEWLNALCECGQEAYLWRPRDWIQIQRTLMRKP